MSSTLAFVKVVTGRNAGDSNENVILVNIQCV